MTGTITQSQAAERLGKNRKTIRNWLNAGLLQSSYVGGIRYVDEASLERLLKHQDLPYRLSERLGVMERVRES